MAAVISAVMVAPLGIAQGGTDLLVTRHPCGGAAVGVLSTAIPYAFEMEALRRLPQAVFGVLMSLEPAVAAAVGFLALSQDLAAARADRDRLRRRRLSRSTALSGRACPARLTRRGG